MQTITISNFAAAMDLTKERSGFMLTRSSGWHDEVERIRTLLPLSQHVLPFLLTGSKEGLPDWGAFSRAFALVHASPYAREVAA